MLTALSCVDILVCLNELQVGKAKANCDADQICCRSVALRKRMQGHVCLCLPETGNVQEKAQLTEHLAGFPADSWGWIWKGHILKMKGPSGLPPLSTVPILVLAEPRKAVEDGPRIWHLITYTIAQNGNLGYWLWTGLRLALEALKGVNQLILEGICHQTNSILTS